MNNVLQTCAALVEANLNLYCTQQNWSELNFAYIITPSHYGILKGVCLYYYRGDSDSMIGGSGNSLHSYYHI